MTKQRKLVYSGPIVNSSDGVVSPSRFRTPYDGNHVRSVISFSKPSRTKQEFKEQCDVNKIVENFTKTGRLDQLNAAHGRYMDLVNLPGSYHEALNFVINARETFETLPSDIRNQFGNDIQAFMEACEKDPNAVFGVLNAAEEGSSEPATPPATPPAEAPVEPQNPSVDD